MNSEFGHKDQRSRVKLCVGHVGIIVKAFLVLIYNDALSLRNLSKSVIFNLLKPLKIRNT